MADTTHIKSKLRKLYRKKKLIDKEIIKYEEMYKRYKQQNNEHKKNKNKI